MNKRIDDAHLNFVLKRAIGKWVDDEMNAAGDIADTQIEAVDEKKLRKLWEKGKRKCKKANKFTLRILKFAAMFLICASVAGVFFAVGLPNAQASVEYIEEEELSKCIRITFKKDENKYYPDRIEKTLTPTYLPDGWTIETHTEGKVTCVYIIRGNNGERIVYSQSIYAGNSLLDNDERTRKTVAVNKIGGVLYEYIDGRKTLLWADEYILNMRAENVDTDVLMKIAKSIK